MVTAAFMAEYLPSDPKCLLALAVFVNPNKTEYIKSIHIYDQNGEVKSVQQEFLLCPGVYSRIGKATVSITLPCAIAASSVGLKPLILALRKMQEDFGWSCILEFFSACPLETIITEPIQLMPSRNAELKSIPSLARDLEVVEAACANLPHTTASTREAERIFSTDNGKLSKISQPHVYLHEKGSGNRDSNTTALTIFPGDPMGPVNDPIPQLETPERTPPQSDVWQKWGSDLELASPRINFLELDSWRTNFEDLNQAPVSSPPSWSSLLDLNWRPPGFASEVDETSSTLPLTGSFYPAPSLNLQLGTPWSLQEPPTTAQRREEQDDGGIDCFPLDCFGIDNSNFYTNDLRNQMAFCSDESIGTGQALAFHSSVEFGIQAPPCNVSRVHQTDNSSTLSSDVYCGGDGEYGGVKPSPNALIQLESPATSTDQANWCRREGRVTRRSGRQQMDKSSINVHNERGTNEHNQKGTNVHNQRGTSDRITEITLQELSQYFHMPITQASKELKVGLTVLKKRCREFGIPRWPHRKMKSLESLINNIQELVRDQGGKSTSSVLNAVKELEEQKRLMEESPGTELAERTKRLRQACFKASYKKRRMQAQQNQGNSASNGNVSATEASFLMSHLSATPTSSTENDPSSCISYVCPRLS